MADIKELTVSCHCGASTHTFIVPTSSLPLPTHLCNCDVSRRISGSLLTSYVNITHTIDHNMPASKPSLKTLVPYKSSDILTRYFCNTCGTHMYLEYHDDGHFEAATGTLQVESTDGIIQYEDMMWVEDTLDGGASHFIKAINGVEIKRYLRGSGSSHEVALDWKHTPPAPCSDSKKSATVRAHCHCNGVEFYISPPNEMSRDVRAEFPDLLYDYQTTDPSILKNPDNELWWLPHPGRFLAGTCACTSCRRISGFDITSWAFIPTCNITLDEAGTVPFSRNPYWGSMKKYRSSEGVTRSFCGKCGANAFWDGDSRPGLVDVAVGLLDAETGARAEEIFAWWTQRVSFAEEALNKGLVKGLQEGLAQKPITALTAGT